MIDENKFNQYGFERTTADIQGITIHNIQDPSAQNYFNYLNEECKDNTSAFHYVVDNEGAIQIMPNTWAVYHTGKALDFGNKNTIAIAICANINDDLYLGGEEKAVELINTLLHEYNLTRNDIYFHKDFNKTVYCPSEILNLYGNKKTFLDKYYILEKGEN